jgi:AcrR family transcriptional regulator
MARPAITREGIIDAATKVIHEKGVAGATTRAVVQTVPCGEGTLYLYFKHRSELILAVIEHSASGFIEELKKLPHYVGQKTVEDNLATILLQAAKFQENVLTVFCGVVSDPKLLHAQQEVMRKARKGPHLSRLAIAGYLEAEKSRGRVMEQLDSEMVAGLLLRTSFGRVFEDRFAGVSAGPASIRHTKFLIAALLAPPGNSGSAGSGNGTRKALKARGKVNA